MNSAVWRTLRIIYRNFYFLNKLWACRNMWILLRNVVFIIDNIEIIIGYFWKISDHNHASAWIYKFYFRSVKIFFKCYYCSYNKRICTELCKPNFFDVTSFKNDLLFFSCKNGIFDIKIYPVRIWKRNNFLYGNYFWSAVWILGVYGYYWWWCIIS